MARHWTKEEELSILQGIGANSINWLCKKGGKRSVFALYHKLCRIGYSGGITRGSYTLNQLMRITGYSRSQLRRAMQSCSQKWRRTSSKGVFIITEDQMDELCDWLGFDFWSKYHRLYRCLWCATQQYSHRAFGLCRSCYNEYRKLLRDLGIDKIEFNNIKTLVIEYFTLVDIEVAEKFINKKRAIPKELLCKYIELRKLRSYGTESCIKRSPIPFT